MPLVLYVPSSKKLSKSVKGNFGIATVTNEIRVAEYAGTMMDATHRTENHAKREDMLSAISEPPKNQF